MAEKTQQYIAHIKPRRSDNDGQTAGRGSLTNTPTDSPTIPSSVFLKFGRLEARENQRERVPFGLTVSSTEHSGDSVHDTKALGSHLCKELPPLPTTYCGGDRVCNIYDSDNDQSDQMDLEKEVSWRASLSTDQTQLNEFWAEKEVQWSDAIDPGKDVSKYSLGPAEEPCRIATADALALIMARYPMPAAPGEKKNLLRYSWLTSYRRIMIGTVLANIAALLIMASHATPNQGAFTYADAATATGANLLAATLTRHENYVNALFWVVTRIPQSAPLQVRRQAAKFAYSQGGIHAGAGISALLWYIFYVCLASIEFKPGSAEGYALVGLSSFTALMLFLMIAVSYPTIRAKRHDVWEILHRFGGYIAVVTVWVEVVIIAAYTSTESVGQTLMKIPTFWFLIVIAVFIVHPLLYLRRHRVDATQLSPHAARLWFHGKSLAPCVATRLSHKPLTENHGFATIPYAHGEQGYSVIVSQAGDFTKKLILDPPEYIWSRGKPTTGLLRITTLFRPAVVIATGSGIGPCLSFLQVYSDHPVRIIWSARAPGTTYGNAVVESVRRADRNAVVIDTNVTRYPRLPALAYALYRESEAEAVVIISNPKVTKEVVYELEKRRVPVFGALFDS